ncbi:RagB/SusD family nutrient uptake outer membrane protein [Flavobacterium frigidarium]|uniref:RagB/SusD family nutrient uptake outer membrane protein n=1 Tax=Flavobacterium frigidarium TaxID=99286 RepID=UPI0030DCEE5C|tara:strand:+ start:12522 stop:13922 length:1401 start_codon:yes stop_codon:yes gene_type:complete
MKIITKSILALSLLFTVASCDDSDLDPTLTVNKEVTTINSANDLRLILSGAYNRMTSEFYYGRDVLIYGDVRSDNAFSTGNSGRFVTPGSMDMVNSDGYARDTFTQIYAVVSSSNLVINTTITGANAEETAQINYYKGQALMLRALAHYDLLRLYGQQNVNGGGLSADGVAYITEFKSANLSPARNTVGEVKNFIYADLDKALTLMDAELDDSTETVTTPAVNGLKARVALYFEDWAIAKQASSDAMEQATINGKRIAQSSEFVNTYTIPKPINTIFELAFRDNDNNSIDGLYNIYASTTYGDIVVLNDFKNLFSKSDVRGTTAMLAIDSKNRLRNVGKFISFQSNVPLIRFEEMVLVNAEASFMINNADATVLTSINSIATNRGAAAYTTVTRDNILKERRKELAFEGFRFDDIARTKQNMPVVDALKQTYDDKGAILYGSYKYAFPIPLVETNANANTKQNAGY